MNPLRSVGARLALALLARRRRRARRSSTCRRAVAREPPRRLAQLDAASSARDRRSRRSCRPTASDGPELRSTATLGAARTRASSSSTTRRRRRSLLARRRGLARASARATSSDDPIALRAAARLGVGARHGRRATASATREVAYRSPQRHRRCSSRRRSHDALATVAVVATRLLIAGAARARLRRSCSATRARRLFARRIRRLERAAERIAGGRFDEPIVDTGTDELGQLARAFDRMRLRLARLDHARREFIANASHELRTPLFSLGGLPRAARRRGARRGDAARVPRRRCASRSSG